MKKEKQIFLFLLISLFSISFLIDNSIVRSLPGEGTCQDCIWEDNRFVCTEGLKVGYEKCKQTNYWTCDLLQTIPCGR